MEFKHANHQYSNHLITELMINFNENLYTTQWLDLVFQNRNKSYGAYELRRHNNETTTKALVYACMLFAALIILPWMYGGLTGKVLPVEVPDFSDPVEVNLVKVQQPKQLPPPPAEAPAPQPQMKTLQYTNMVVAPASEDNVEPPSQVELTTAVVGQVAAAGVEGVSANAIETPAITGTGVVEAPSENTVFSTDLVEKLPEYPGGQDAFAKFLSRNLRYPGMAAERGIQGRVLVSFIIERNGELSNIKILRGIGAGCDEEAIRVLSKSPRWNPGIQNKQNVRVAYNIPINFRLP